VTDFDAMGLDILKANLKNLQWPRFGLPTLPLRGPHAFQSIQDQFLGANDVGNHIQE
jgi:hypothetical protein